MISAVDSISISTKTNEVKVGYIWKVYFLRHEYKYLDFQSINQSLLIQEHSQYKSKVFVFIYNLTITRTTGIIKQRNALHWLYHY